MPVSQCHLTDYRGFGVSDRLRAARERRGLTLRALGEVIGISAAQLSNFETGKTAPDVRELARLAEALGAVIADLVPANVEYPYLISRRSERAHRAPIGRQLYGADPEHRVHHNRVWPLADVFVGKHMEPLLTEIHPLADRDLRFIGHDSEEFMFVLDGEVESRIKTSRGVDVERLGPGDCLYFRSWLPHCHRSLRATPARSLNVIYSIRGTVDSDEANLPSPRHPIYRLGAYDSIGAEAIEKIALVRRLRGWTVPETARALGITARQLTRVESGAQSPDLNLLLRIARMFRVPMTYFFASAMQAEAAVSHVVQRAAQTRELPPRPRRIGTDPVPHVFRPLVAPFPDRGLHPYYIQVKRRDGAPRGHHGQEFIYVLDGEIELVTYSRDGELVETLGPDDSVFLDSSVPHILRGLSRNPYANSSAELIDVFWTPVGEEHLFAE